MRTLFFTLLLFLLLDTLSASAAVLNVYTWSNYIPNTVVAEFEKKTGIKVRVNEYDSTETMYAKIIANPHSEYDIVFPSSYYVARMRKDHLLLPLNFNALSNVKYLNPHLLNQSFDPHNQYSLPYTWGTTGILFDKRYWNPKQISKWSDLWQPRFVNQLLLYDDAREVFAMAFIVLKTNINQTDPSQIAKAYQQLKGLIRNVRLFNSDAVINIYADDDATIGMAENGDALLAEESNPNLKYIYPEDGFSIWIDCMAVLKYAPHPKEAMQFINFLMQPNIAKEIVLAQGFSTPNLAAMALLPKSERENPVFNPPASTLQRGQMQDDIGDAVMIYQKYWQWLKLASD